ncbi:MAG: hypothetical protein JXA09_12360 [Anaerolineae bacterium]|nr:hypothetical protein [Anaerolineae bacterium]
MKQELKSVYPLILTVVVISTGVVVLLSLVIESYVLESLRALFVEWTVIVIAFALLLGVFNVVRVHARRIQAGKGALYSVVLVVAFLVVFIPGILSPERVPAGLRQWVGPTGGVVDFAYRYVQRPLQATMFALMGFFVFTAAWRVFRIRSATSLVMFVAALVVLLGSIRLGTAGGWMVPAEASDWVLNVPVKAGARGLMLGIALATVVSGLRLLLGIDRSYHE